MCVSCGRSRACVPIVSVMVRVALAGLVMVRVELTRFVMVRVQTSSIAAVITVYELLPMAGLC